VPQPQAGSAEVFRTRRPHVKPPGNFHHNRMHRTLHNDSQLSGSTPQSLGVLTCPPTAVLNAAGECVATSTWSCRMHSRGPRYFTEERGSRGVCSVVGVYFSCECHLPLHTSHAHAASDRTDAWPCEPGRCNAQTAASMYYLPCAYSLHSARHPEQGSMMTHADHGGAPPANQSAEMRLHDKTLVPTAPIASATHNAGAHALPRSSHVHSPLTPPPMTCAVQCWPQNGLHQAWPDECKPSHSCSTG
jgi:hypothetical protein